MDVDSQEHEWNQSRNDLIAVLERFGTHATSSDGDFWLSEENLGGSMHALYVFNISRLTCALLAEVMGLLKEKYAIWDVVFIMDFKGGDGKQVPPEGIFVTASFIDELWDRAALAALCGQDLDFSGCADLFLSHQQGTEDAGLAHQDASVPPDGISRCYEALDKVGNRLSELDEPCRTAIIVNTAWGIIGNGGFNYFFENNFDDDVDYDVFTQAFYRVGLTEIASRFSRLVRMFPFSHPHLAPEQRRDYMESQPRDFMAAADELEKMIYARDDIDEILNAFIHASE